MMIIDNKYSIGQTVYLVTDGDQLPRLVSAIKVLPNNSLVYDLCNGPTLSGHYEFEISDEKQTVLS